MQHFSKRLKSSGGSFNFYFNALADASEVRYHVSFVDKENKARAFIMYKLRNHWLMQDRAQCPDWIQELERQISGVLDGPVIDDHAGTVRAPSLMA